ncbi:MAG: aminopeptidase P family N-terminal domain-containing protein [Lachnospiraceae bacterium]|nr:aminopeptidase P family N-terminal domain-containing protein [Lachnospiraceae bacterium]
MTVTERIQALREEMKKAGVDIYIVPSADFHQSEYAGAYFAARKYITGFTGSAGTAIIMADEAYLWTDGRYFIQAAQQLEGSPITLMKMGEPDVPTIEEFLKDHIKEGQTLGFDGRVVSKGQGTKYAEITQKNGAVISYREDLIDKIWTDRPALSTNPAFHLDIRYTGETAKSKLARIREEMQKEGADLHVLTTLDDICWTFNFRGNDVRYSPLVYSYCLIAMDHVDLYMDEAKADAQMLEDFAENHVTIHPYNDIYQDIQKLTSDQTLLLDPERLNYALYNLIPAEVTRVEKRNPEILMKAIKNETELQNIRQAELKDSVAHVRFMKWLKEHVGQEKITEISASDKLDEFRAEMGNFLRPSFGPISSYGEHGAIVHYSSTPETDVELKPGALYLTDTGAGFYEGSTDITRTYALGEVPQIMKDHFTLVAISNLSLANVKFKEGACGQNLDYAARRPFWERGLDYNHGTGHGVGYLLNIHEGPAGFRWQIREGAYEPLQEGMIITDEPGIYIEGSHGIRLENEVLVRKGERNAYGQFMYLETLTYIPFDLDAINPDMMSEQEKDWLNAYHHEVYEKLCPMLREDEREWLKKYTRAI